MERHAVAHGDVDLVSTLTDIDADPVIDRGRVFALGQGGRMAAYELVTGQRIWEINIAGISTPATAGEWVFVLTSEAKLLCVQRSQRQNPLDVATCHGIAKRKTRRTASSHGVVRCLSTIALIVANSRGQLWSVCHWRRYSDIDDRRQKPGIGCPDCRQQHAIRA